MSQQSVGDGSIEAFIFINKNKKESQSPRTKLELSGKNSNQQAGAQSSIDFLQSCQYLTPAPDYK